MLVELIVALGLPVWLCVEEIVRLRSARTRAAASEATARAPRKELVFSRSA